MERVEWGWGMNLETLGPWDPEPRGSGEWDSEGPGVIPVIDIEALSTQIHTKDERMSSLAEWTKPILEVALPSRYTDYRFEPTPEVRTN